MERTAFDSYNEAWSSTAKADFFISSLSSLTLQNDPKRLFSPYVPFTYGPYLQNLLPKNRIESATPPIISADTSHQIVFPCMLVRFIIAQITNSKPIYIKNRTIKLFILTSVFGLLPSLSFSS